MNTSRPSGEADARAFRDCVGTFATGVTVVAAQREGVYAGMTLNAFTSVSLDPLLVCVSIARRTRTHELVRDAGRFTVNILRAGQEDVARAFAVAGGEFPHSLTATDADAHVRVEGALAVLRCSVANLIAAGDHDLVLARVDRFETAPGHPLLFHRGAFSAHAA